MKLLRCSAASVAAFLLATACTSTTLTTVWVSPDHGPPPRHVLVVAVRKDAARRHVWEDAFVEGLKARGINAEPSYTISPDAPPTEAQLHERLPGGRFDAALVVRSVGRDERSFYVPARLDRRPVGYVYSPFYRSYVTMYQRTYTPGYTETEKVVMFETSLWGTTGEGSLVWSGHSETTDPSSAHQLSAELSKVVFKAMAKDGVI